jgi:hypothetical protein
MQYQAEHGPGPGEVPSVLRTVTRESIRQRGEIERRFHGEM